MNKQRHPANQHSNSGRMWAGIIILGIGTVLLAGKLGLDWFLPHWLFNWYNIWPMILIVVGLVIGGNSNFRNPASYILLGIGIFFLIRNITHVNIGAFIWPVVTIGIGLWLLMGKRRGTSPLRADRHPRSNERKDDYAWDKRVAGEGDDLPPNGATASDETGGFGDTGTFSEDDYLKSTSIFSDIKKR